MSKRGERSIAVSGEIGDDGPVVRREPPRPPPPSGALLRIRDQASDLARSMRRPFLLLLEPNGDLVHEEEPRPGAICSSVVRHHADAAAHLARLRALITRADLEGAPADSGSGAASLQIEWLGDGAPRIRTFRWNRRGTVRDLDGVAITRERLQLLDSLVALIDWVDLGAAAPVWPANALPLFPDLDTLVHGRRAARLSATHDWDGPNRHAQLHELVLTESGAIHRNYRLGDRPRPPETRGIFAASPDTRAALERIVALDPARFRRHLGFTRGECTLDTTYSRVLDYFDGTRVHTTSFVFGAERGIGVALGDAPPDPRESEAFELLGQMMRRG